MIESHPYPIELLPLQDPLLELMGRARDQSAAVALLGGFNQAAIFIQKQQHLVEPRLGVISALRRTHQPNVHDAMGWLGRWSRKKVDQCHALIRPKQEVTPGA